MAPIPSGNSTSSMNNTWQIRLALFVVKLWSFSLQKSSEIIGRTDVCYPHLALLIRFSANLSQKHVLLERSYFLLVNVYRRFRDLPVNDLHGLLSVYLLRPNMS